MTCTSCGSDRVSYDDEFEAYFCDKCDRLVSERP